METNPYAAPQSDIVSAPVGDEVVRREHLDTEANFKGLGLLYYLGGGVGMVVGVMRFFTTHAGSQAQGLVYAVIGLALGVLMFATGFGLRRLSKWAKIPTAIFSAFGLLAFPLGTIINGFILYLLVCPKGRFVMTPEYQRVVAATPHVKRKTSILLLILVALLIVLVLGIAILIVVR